MSDKVPPQPRTGDSTPSDESKDDFRDDAAVHRAPNLSPLPSTLVTGPPLRTDSVLGNWTLTMLGIRKKTEPPYDLDAIATRESLWDSGNVAELKEKFISPKWENLEAFDPDFRWTYREEREVRRIIDWKVMTWICVMFAALNIDRGNINNAVSDNMLDDLGLTQGDYNLGRTLSRLGFLLAELPSQLISKRLGPDIWLPMQIVIFSAISASQFWLSGRASFLACRYLLATFQGGVIPDTILYLSYYYPSAALPIRLAWYWTSSNLVDIGVGFGAVGLLKMRGVLGYAGWRWLFLIEGLITMVIGILSFGLMPMSPVKCKTWFVRKGYFTPRQSKIIVNSVIRDDPAKGGMHNRQALSLKDIWHCIKDYDMWPIYILGLLFGIPAGPVGQYLTLSFRGLGFNVVETNLLTIPNTIGGAITMLGITAISELVNNRSFVAMAEDAWLIPCFIALVTLPDPVHPWAYFAIATVLLSYPYTHAIQVAWTSRNSGSVRNRTCSAALYNMMVQLSGIIHANVYQASDRPRYKKANRGLIAIAIWMCVVQYPGTFFYYKWRNKKKAEKWDAMTPLEKETYLETTTDEGNKRLDFRFAT